MNTIESLSTDLSAEAACGSIAKLLGSIAINKLNTLSYANIETALKAAVYIDKCVGLIGKFELQQKCNHPIYKRVFQNDEIFSGTSLIYVIKQILQTKNSTDHIYAIDHILKAIKSPSEVEELWNSIILPVPHKPNCKRREEMQLVVQRIFKLPKEHIDTAVERLLAQLQFSRVGLLFCEPYESPYIDKYIVLVHKICCRLKEGNVPKYFLQSMLNTIQHSDQGLKLYWQCLLNETFTQALVKYLITYMSRTDTDENEHHMVVVLMSAALRDESPCQRELFDKLYNGQLPSYWLNLFQNAVFAFDVFS